MQSRCSLRRCVRVHKRHLQILLWLAHITFDRAGTYERHLFSRTLSHRPSYRMFRPTTAVAIQGPMAKSTERPHLSSAFQADPEIAQLMRPDGNVAITCSSDVSKILKNLNLSLKKNMIDEAERAIGDDARRLMCDPLQALAICVECRNARKAVSRQRAAAI